MTHLLARSRADFLRASHGLSCGVSFSRSLVLGMVFFWTGRGNAVDEPLRDPETLKGGMGGVHTLDGLDAGDKKGPRNMVVAELALGRLAPAPSVMAAAADVR